MTIPNVAVTILDGQIGIVTPSVGNSTVTFGASSKAIPNTLYGGYQGNLTQLVTDLGYGPGVEALALKVASGGGPHYFMSPTPSYDGALSAVTAVKAGAGALTVAMAPASTITVVIVTAGAIGTFTATFAIGSGAASAPVQSVAGWSSTGYLVPGTQTTLVFANNAGVFNSGDTHTISNIGVITAVVGVGAGTVASQTSQPFDDYTFRVQILSTGSPATGTFRWASDNFYADDGSDLSNWSSTIVIPGTPFKYAVPNTGVYLIFSNASFTAGDYFTFTSIATGFTTSNVTAAFTALFLLGTGYGGGHVAAMPTSSANGATLATTVDGNMVTALAAKKFIWWMTDTPTVGSRVLSGGLPIADTADTDSVVAAAFVNTTYVRTCAGAGDFLCSSPINGRLCRRPASWQASARAGAVGISHNLHRVKDGPLPFMVKLYRNEETVQALDAARLNTLRTITGKGGFFITRGRTLADATSDFSNFMHRRVMDEACRVIVAAAANLIGDTVVLNDNGTIDEGAAQQIEGGLNATLTAAIVDSGDASGASVTVSRTHNIAADSAIPISVKIIPLGTLDEIDITIGYSIQTAATSAVA